jgi:hypothetical protein
MKWFDPSLSFSSPDSASHHHAPSELCPAPKISCPGAVKERRRQSADLLFAEDKCCLCLIKFSRNPLHRHILKELRMWNNGKRVSGQRLFREDIDKIKRDTHYTLSRSGNWLNSQLWVDLFAAGEAREEAQSTRGRHNAPRIQQKLSAIHPLLLPARARRVG